MGTPARYYSSTAVRTTLSSSIGTSDSSISVASDSGFPPSYPYILVLEKDTANEEIVEVTGNVGTALSVTRGVDGTSARSHSAGVSVEHALIADDLTDFRAHEAAAAGVHDIGAGASVVGTTTAQTLSNKTLGSNLAAGGFRITGLGDPSSAQDAVTKNWAETGMSSQLVQATTQATNAASSASAASSSASAASASQSAAATSASNAASSASSASGSASTATTQAGIATTKAGEASTSATNAASSASAAAASQAAAASSATAASGSASTASTQASNAATSAGQAATSASNAAGSATAALASETAAAASASAASGSASTAASEASNAAASAAAALSSETHAASSEGAAAASAAAALASESAAAASESAAAGSASSAASSASAASADAVAAASSAAAAATALDQFDDRYLGSKSSFPTLDNDGDALVQGALFYLNTGTAEQIGMYVYDGASWLKASAASVASIVTYEFTATSGQTSFTGLDDNGVALSFTTGLVQVFLNGVLLSPGDDYTTSTNTVTLASGAAASDVVVIVAFASFNVANTYTTSQADSTFATKTELATQLSSAGFNPFLLMGA